MSSSTESDLLHEKIRLLQLAVVNLTTTVQQNMKLIKTLSQAAVDRPSVIYTKRHTEHPVGLDAIGYIAFVILIFAGSLFLLMLMAIRKANENQALTSYFLEYVDRDTCRKRKFQEQIWETKEKLRPPARCNSFTSLSQSNEGRLDAGDFNYLINSQDNLFSFSTTPTELKSPLATDEQLLSPIAAISKCNDLLLLMAKLHNIQNIPPLSSKCSYAPSSLQRLSPVLLPEPQDSNLPQIQQNFLPTCSMDPQHLDQITCRNNDTLNSGNSEDECLASSSIMTIPMSSEETTSSSFENSYYLNSDSVCVSTKSEPIIRECIYGSGYSHGDKNTWV